MPPDADLAEAARLGAVTEIIADPSNLDVARTLNTRVLVLGGGENRDLHLPEGTNVIDMEQIDPDAVELPGWYRPNPGLAQDLAFVAFSTVAGKLVAKQITNYRWALSAFGTASTAARLISTPTALRPRLRAATRVAPEPENGSAMTPAGHLRIRCSMRLAGFW